MGEKRGLAIESMKFYRVIIGISICFCLQASSSIDYLLTTNKFEKALDTYILEYKGKKKHNHKTLKSLAFQQLQNGANGTSIREKILTIHALKIASCVPDITLLNSLVRTQNPSIQIACIHLLEHLADDRLQGLYAYGLNSSFLQVRFEALVHHVMRNEPNSFGILSSLMNLIPPQYHPSLVELFAVLNSDAARQKLRSFLSSKENAIRLAAIKAITDHNLGEFTQDIRKLLSHTDPSIKEASLDFARKQHDIHALEQINLALKSPYRQVQIAAIKASNAFGKIDCTKRLNAIAKDGDLFAIYSLREEKTSSETLANLLKSAKKDIRFNAALSLLKNKNNACKNVIKEILQCDPNYEALLQHHSPGMALVCIKSRPLATFKHEGEQNYYKMQTHQLLASILANCMHLDETSFLEIITTIFENKKLHLVPHSIRLIENRSSPRIKQFLHKQANCLAAPLIRSYAQLSLYKKDKTHLSKKQLYALIDTLKNIHIVELEQNPQLATNPRTGNTHFDLSLQEKSSLYLQALELVMMDHDHDALSCLVNVFKTGLKQNRYIIAGLLIKCLN